ncbi:Fur family transcriptional regulator [Erysipelothrix urinaevulpis]|uniref:Fur family transcriptional regulator n=1 Tax=Erysipelothrix urinaevulpis TaxID=2683717 RepID=UPI00135C70B2|nr:Fur family transcriptional regulator [Erysipelothrix urinaevulpis]
MKVKEELKSNGLKYTKQRADVLHVLKSSEIPLTINQIRDELQIEMDLSTIYRILDAFEAKHLVNKTVPIEPSMSLYDYNRDIHKHHLTCTECGIIIVIESCPLGNYEKQVQEKTGYIIERHQLELYGLCPRCQRSN